MVVIKRFLLVVFLIGCSQIEGISFNEAVASIEGFSFGSSASKLLIPFCEPLFNYFDKKNFSKKPEASQFYKKHFYEALKSYNTKKSSDVMIKNNSTMKDLGAASLGGIEFNEKALEEYSTEKRIHTCYHEAAHYVLDHVKFPKINYLVQLVKLAGLGGLMYLTKKFNKSQFLKIMSCGINLINVSVEYSFFKKKKPEWLDDPIEKEADLLAIEHLIKDGKESYVQKIKKDYEKDLEESKHFPAVFNNLIYGLSDLYKKSPDEKIKLLIKEAKENYSNSLLTHTEIFKRSNRWNQLYEKAKAKLHGVQIAAT